MIKKIVVTGGSGRFGTALKKVKTKNKIFFPNKKELNILNYKNIQKYLQKKKPSILIHLAGLSRPMKIHEKDITKSIDLNIIGTSNITKACEKKNIKLIYFSTSYVYPDKKGNCLESNSLLPGSSYAWSKLGGEAAVHLYKNSLILRVCMTEKPFVHKVAFANVKTNFIYQQDLAKKLIKLISKKGIYNIGGEAKTIYKFALKENKNIKKKISKGEFPKKMDMNISKMNKILKK